MNTPGKGRVSSRPPRRRSNLNRVAEQLVPHGMRHLTPERQGEKHDQRQRQLNDGDEAVSALPVAALLEKLRHDQRADGSSHAPEAMQKAHMARLVVQRHCENALALARFLEADPRVGAPTATLNLLPSFKKFSTDGRISSTRWYESSFQTCIYGKDPLFPRKFHLSHHLAPCCQALSFRPKCQLVVA